MKADVTTAPLLLDATAAAKAIGVSRSFLYTLTAAAKAPAPLKIGRRSLWRRADLELWVARGCPDVKGGAP